jgi:hypothetical protein
MSESVEIVLNGIDKTSPMFEKVTKSLERTGGFAKKLNSTFGLFGKLGIDVGPFQEMTNTVSEGVEAAQAFGQGLDKTGVAAALLGSAIAGMQLGKAFYDALPNVVQMRKELAELNAQADRDAQVITNRLTEHIDMLREVADLQGTPAEKIAVQQEAMTKLNSLIEEQEATVSEVNERLKSHKGFFSNMSQDAIDTVEKQKAREDELLETLTKQRQELEAQMRPEHERLTAAKEAAKAREQEASNSKTMQDEIARLQRETLAMNDPATAAALERHKLLTMAGVTEEMKAQYKLEVETNEAAAKAKEVRDKEKQDAEKKAEEAKRQIESEKNLIENLKIKLIALREGEDAAEAYRMAQDGVSAATIATAQAIKDEIEAQEQYNDRLQELQDSLKEQEQNDKNHIEALQLKNYELRHGAEAAEDYRAKLAGVSDEAIAQGKAIREENKRLEKEAEEKDKREEERKRALEEAKKGFEAAGQLQATESRMLTRGSGSPAADMAKKTENLVRLTETGIRVWEGMLGALNGIYANTAAPDEVLGA